jgi:hypothetical protein
MPVYPLLDPSLYDPPEVEVTSEKRTEEVSQS